MRSIIILLFGFSIGYISSNYQHDSAKQKTQESTPSSKKNIVPNDNSNLIAYPSEVTGSDKNEIAYLLRVNQELLSKLNNINQSKKNLLKIEKMIDELPKDYLSEQLKKKLKIPSLENIDNIHDFSKNLFNKAVEDNNYDDLENIDIQFSFSPILGKQQFAGTTKAATNDKIFAYIGTDSKKTRNVIVKWKKTKGNELINFRYFAVSANSSYNYIAASPLKGWATGSYRVSVYDIDNQLTPLASKTYSISDIVETPNNSREAIYNDLLLSNQASPAVRK